MENTHQILWKISNATFMVMYVHVYALYKHFMIEVRLIDNSVEQEQV